MSDCAEIRRYVMTRDVMTTRWSGLVALLVALNGPLVSAQPQDRKAAAAALFENGIRDMHAGQTERACSELAESVATWPDSGAKGALAECDTALGRLSDAWELWRDLATTAPTQDLRDDATQNAAALDRKLVRIVLRLRGQAPPTLVVTINGKPFSTLANAERRIEPGTLVVDATSPDTAPWTQTLSAQAGTTITVEILLRPSSAPLRRQRSFQVMGLSLLVAGAVGLGVGAASGGMAYVDWRSASDACGGNTGHCKGAGFASAQSDLDHARTAATISTVSSGIGAGVAALGALLYIFNRPRASESETAWRVAPLAGSQTMGLVLSRSMP
ncbi:MAG TPA: hypothetical protein VF516_25340 [Kofleriaceae bacterium]